MKPFCSLRTTLLVVFIAFNAIALAQHSPVFPQPVSVSYSGGEFVVPALVPYSAAEDLPELPAQLFSGDAPGRLIPAQGSQSAVAVFKRSAGFGSEGYGIEISQQQIVVEYSELRGAYYAQLTLAQLFAQRSAANTVRCARITDRPAFAYRGVHLDCARHFFTISEIKVFIDEIARLKFNRFHWHLTDDQGWRIEIKKYPRLTEIGGWRDSTLIGHFSSDPQVYEKKRYGGFYTQEQAREIVEYAGSYGIAVVPEIEMPGHARAAIHAYPELSCTGKDLPVEGLWGVFDDIFCSKPATRQFLKDVLDEVMAIFPSEVIHIGGDEAPKVRWDACPSCAEMKAEHGLSNSHELQSFFIQDIENHVRSKGRTIIGWDEILEGGLAANAKVMSWRGEEGGIAAAKLGHDVVMTPTAYCYLDYYQSGDPGEPLAIGGYLPLEKVYAFNPLPATLSEKEKRFILGGQANFWTEYIPDVAQLQYMAFPRLVAMSEVLWTGRPMAYKDFVAGLMSFYLPGLEQRGVNFSRSFLLPKLVPQPVADGMNYVVEYPVEAEGQESVAVFVPRTKDVRLVEQDLTIGKKADGTAIKKHVLFKSHALVGIPIIFATAPDAKYNNHGNMALTDGVTGARPWKGDQWLGFSNDTVQFTIDLGKTRKVRSIQLGTLNDPGSWIYSPKKIVVERSSDGQVYSKVCSSNITKELVDWKSRFRARYLRVTLINDEFIPAGNSGAGTTPWTFIDELIIK